MAQPGAPLCTPRPQPLWCPHRCPQSLGGPGSGGPRLAPLSGAHRLCGRTGQRAGSLARFLLSVNPKPSSVGLRASAADSRLRDPCWLLLSPAQSGFGFLWATGLGSLGHLPPQPKCGPGTLVPQRVFAWHQGAPAVRVVSLGCQGPRPWQSPTHDSAPSPLEAEPARRPRATCLVVWGCVAWRQALKSLSPILHLVAWLWACCADPAVSTTSVGREADAAIFHFFQITPRMTVNGMVQSRRTACLENTTSI